MRDIPDVAGPRTGPFDEALMWAAVGMACASVVVLLGGGGAAHLLGSTLLSWVSLLLALGLSAPIAGMVIGADAHQLGGDSVSRSSHGFAIGGGILGGCVVAAVQLMAAFG